jgi:hypothetical protein
MNASEWQAWSDALAAKHQIRVEERDFFPRGVAAFSACRSRTITVPPLAPCLSEAVLLTRAATRAHEFGHVLRGECPKEAPHYRDPKVTDWHHCVACEAEAWESALQILPTLTRGMHRSLKASLGLYLRTTPAYPAAKDSARRLTSDATYGQLVQGRLDRDLRLEAYAEMQAIAEDARRPRPLTKLEQQIADVRGRLSMADYGWGVEWERAADGYRRARNPLDDDIRAALDRGVAGALCAECRHQQATVVVRRRVLMCRRCADVDHACRSMDAMKLRLDRKHARTT